MPPRDWTFRIEDILESIGRIEEYVAEMSFETFVADRKTVDAVVRNITIIGEAARHISPELRKKHPQIPWDDVREIRNVVVHEYFGIDHSILWQTVTQNLPTLKVLLKAVLKREPH